MTTARSVSIPAPARVVHVTLWVVQILLAAFFVMAAVPKLAGDPAAVAAFDTIGFGQWFRYLTGACELAGAVGLVVPRLSGVAAIGLVGLMVGATVTNLFLLPGMAAAALFTVVLGIVFGVIAWVRRPQTRALAAVLRG